MGEKKEACSHFPLISKGERICEEAIMARGKERKILVAYDRIILEASCGVAMKVKIRLRCFHQC